MDNDMNKEIYKNELADLNYKRSIKSRLYYLTKDFNYNCRPCSKNIDIAVTKLEEAQLWIEKEIKELESKYVL